MRRHELWCQSRYQENGVWGVCDCGAEQENAEQLAPQQTGLKRRKQKVQWRGELPDQFCVKCEQAPVKRLTIEPHDKTKPTRDFAACLSPECAHIREIQRDAE